MYNTSVGFEQYQVRGKQYAFNFQIWKDSDIIVEVDGNIVPAVVEIHEVGGVVTLVHEPVGTIVTLSRNLAIDRDVDYISNGDLRADTLDYDQNYQTTLIRDLSDRVDDIVLEPVGTIRLVTDGTLIPTDYRLADGTNGTTYVPSPTGTKYIQKIN